MGKTTNAYNKMKDKVYILCPDCKGELHCQLIDGAITDAFCFTCHKDIDIKKIIFCSINNTIKLRFGTTCLSFALKNWILSSEYLIVASNHDHCIAWQKSEPLPNGFLDIKDFGFDCLINGYDGLLSDEDISNLKKYFNK